MNRSSAHHALVAQILALSVGRPDLILLEFKVGAAMSMSGAIFKYGTKGVSDIIGFRAPHAQFIAIEIKTGTGKLTKEQRAFKCAVERCGGIFIEARSIEDVRHI